jgi:hypothetical protein
MQGSASKPPADRSRPPPFRPRFTIGIVYLVAFFLFFAFLQVLPDLIGLLSSMPPGPEQQQAAERIMRDGSSPLVSLALSLGATSLGTWYQLLPGMRS